MTVPDWAGYLRFRSAFEKTTDPAFYPIAWLDDQILSGAAWPIIGDNAAIVMEARQYPGGVRVGHVLIAAGDLREIVERLAPVAEDWSRANGCQYGLIESREGWAKVMKSHGWRVHQIALIKEL
jgi:hypothetical protein